MMLILLYVVCAIVFLPILLVVLLVGFLMFAGGTMSKAHGTDWDERL